MPGPAARSPEERRSRLATRLTPAVLAALGSGRRYGELTVEDVCAEARIARSTYYTSFKDKDDLLRVIGADAVDDLARAGRAWLDPPLADSRAELHRRMALLVATYRRHQFVLRALIEQASVDEGIRQDLRALFDLALREFAARLVDDGPGVDDLGRAQDMAHWLIAMLDRGLYQLIPFDQDRVEGLTSALVDVFWSVLRRPSDVDPGARSVT